MRLTREKALRICRDLWIWMAQEKKSGLDHKKDWPGWEKYGEMKADCPCCEYNHRQKWTYCSRKCLLGFLWPDGCINDSSSPYNSFHYTKGTPADAMKIVRGCEAALRKLNKKVATYRFRVKS